MKKLDKVLSVLMVVVMVALVCTNVFAAINPDDITSNKDVGAAGTTITSIGSTILTIITNVGIVLAIILVAVLGVKYMMGSTEEKAEYKKSFMPLIIGIVLVVSATTIAAFIFNMAK